MVFRRRRETDELPDEAVADGLDATDGGLGAADGTVDEVPSDRDDALIEPATTVDTEPYAVVVPTRPQGPWDSHDVPDDDVPRLDLGGMMLPIHDGIEVRIEVQDDVPVAATLVDDENMLQVHAFAAPKSSGLWDAVRAEIAESLVEAGGSATSADGPFGSELHAQIPAEGGLAAARFLGVDGPRWFLRGMVTGPAATDAGQAALLEQCFRNIVVNRGGEAMAPRDLLAIHLPREVLEAGAMSEEDEPESQARSLQLPERGPEITEIQ
jgi:Protein of unknown function (DUF3710)